MIAHRHTTKIIAAAMAAAVCLCLAAILFSGQLNAAAGNTGVAMEYETALFDTETPITINIIMEETDWEEMLENAAEEKYYSCDVEINGTRFYKVGIRPKGNTSLSTIVSDPTTDRYSFKLEFDHYVEGQTCFGLDKLILNNNYADATNMKEAIVYDMYQYLGADASLYNYAGISVNGEYWGCYLALEGVEDSFLLRNYGVSSGNLYKPEGMQMGGGGNGSGSGGADLNYTDDDLDSYGTIWDGEIGSTGKKDHKRVVEALKNISEGTDLESYMDIDNLLKYMAVHVFSVNEDSLSGTMAHNYYLYESGGKLNLIPWDYNLAFGGMGGGGEKTENGASGKDFGGNDASSVINSPIDGAFSGTTFFDTLMENEEYREIYYSYLKQLAEEYIDGGALDAFYERTRANIDALIETDPTAFYTYEEYDEAAELLMQVVRLRGESVEGQVNGTIPSTKSGQTDSDALIDASDIDLSILGSMNTGGGGDNRNGGPGGAAPEGFAMPGAGEAPEGFTAPGDGEAPEGVTAPGDGEAPGGVTAPGDGEASEETETVASSESQETDGADGEEIRTVSAGMDTAEKKVTESSTDAKEVSDSQENEMPQGGHMEGGFPQGGPGMDGFGSSEDDTTVRDNLLLYGISFGVLVLALLFAGLFRRRSRKR